MMDFNYSHILVGIDGSKTAAKAVRQAITIAEHNHAKLTIVAIINDREILGVSKAALIGFGNANQTTIDEVKSRYQRLIHKYALMAADRGIEVNSFVTSGDPKNTLAHTLVDDEDIDAIVVGATGANFVDRMTMGSTAAFVIAQAPCDVFVIHRD
ncbi:putative universal stress protein [Lentilactobacillus parabuchneri]|jgi:nucleotide-binding universal stress UspA family protein|nr:universal stress protein [Lentilactobacillus parabuchneri]APR08257.1 Putative universal stress protein [Lentilactobacillus parabuchneri]MBW0244699.1 universal stress protein [Lentilactobacillus parabuchneri]MBW0262777.1 universal stress protein [Lentilactobacillus parabuchneri]MCT2884594.1 universal stress protein [Lentilactobacillus parabuchneri]MDG9738080.1 universal stress protein [Lentilactobacillus parabuchneri]